MRTLLGTLIRRGQKKSAVASQHSPQADRGSGEIHTVVPPKAAQSGSDSPLPQFADGRHDDTGLPDHISASLPRHRSIRRVTPVAHPPLPMDCVGVGHLISEQLLRIAERCGNDKKCLESAVQELVEKRGLTR